MNKIVIAPNHIPAVVEKPKLLGYLEEELEKYKNIYANFPAGIPRMNDFDI